MKKYTQEELDKILYLINHRSIKEIALAIGRTVFSTKSKIRSMGLKVKVRSNPHGWSFNQKCLLKENYGKLSNKEVSVLLDKSVFAIKAMANKLGLKKSHNPSQFKKGRKPHNKGIKQATSEKVYKTTFKKGNVPPTTKMEGSLYERANNSECAIYYKPYGAKKVVRYANFIWEEAHGKIPKGYIVSYKDKDWRNCSLDNLCIMSRAELLRSNANRKKAAESTKITNIVKNFNENSGNSNGKRLININK